MNRKTEVNFINANIYLRFKGGTAPYLWRAHKKIALRPGNPNRGVLVQDGMPVGKMKGKWVYSAK